MANNRERINNGKRNDPMNKLPRTSEMYLVPVRSPLYQNFDFSSFPYLVRKTWVYLREITMRKSVFDIPYCAFLHVCTGVLNAAILGHVKRHTPGLLRGNIIDDSYFRYQLPAPIAQYISHVAEGEAFKREVVINIPEDAIPRAYSPFAPEFPAGSFGIVDKNSHNVYECYISPYVTRRLIEATRDRDEHWEPLPEHLKPVGGIPNNNLLGYSKIDEISRKEKDFLEGIEFPDDYASGVEARLQWSSELHDKVMSKLDSIFYNMEFVTRPYHMNTLGGTKEAVVGFVEACHREKSGNDTYLGELNCKVLTYRRVENALMCRALCFGLKRRRTRSMPGLCYTLGDGQAPEGWIEHINDNFFMKGLFEARVDKGNAQLQCGNFEGDENLRQILLHDYIRYFHLRRPYSSSSSD